ncbi:hypothetical protein QBC38DRAFT_125217 [Podospora fimiseda]|uniref:DUF7726 domain-containing protein n=1 Tax=Podospora fimiseda TaxID=252190 RepID=A0AAN7BTH9_9PEZI|nr:hypothetical protein QBC38DRAFT_125217 [Podospora fimiseda]
MSSLFHRTVLGEMATETTPQPPLAPLQGAVPPVVTVAPIQEPQVAPATAPIPARSPLPTAGKENVQTAPAVPVTKAPAKNLKRKSGSGVELDPARLEEMLDELDSGFASITENCDQVRRKVNRFIDSGAMTKTAFAKEIGVSAKSLNGFLGCHGPMKGNNFAAYGHSWAYFRKFELTGESLPAPKKQKTTPTPAAAAAATASASTATPSAGTATTETPAAASKKAAIAGSAPTAADIADIALEGEEKDEVPIFDSCDEVRKKINAHLKKDGVTQAQFCRDVYAQLKGPSKPGKCFQGVQLSRFRGMKGTYEGAKSPFYYGAYVFFEKLRIKEVKPKSKHRLEMERQWGEDGGIERDGGRWGYQFFEHLCCSLEVLVS